MDDELVKRLRNAAIRADSGNEIGESFYRDIMQAADTIEELSKYADTIRKLKREGWYLQRTKYQDGYQAIGTMPLPQPPKEE
jgi:hypothetical protein